MARPTLYIAMKRSRLEALLTGVRGGDKEASVALNPQDFAASWDRDLAPLDGPLGDLLADLGLPANARVFLGYESPQGFADVLHFDDAVPMDTEHAGLKISDRVSFAVSANPIAVKPLTNGSTGKNAALVTADADASVEALSGWLARAGLTLEEAAPLPAWALTGLLRDPPESSDPVALVDVGASTTVIAGFRSGELVFSRTVNAGFDMVVEALASLAVRVESELNGEPSDNVEEKRAGIRQLARGVLFAQGIPGRDDRIEIGPGLDGTRVLGAMQPVLQRFAVEIRQTIRFGFGETDLLRTRLGIVGPGSGIRSFEDVLVTQLELESVGNRAEKSGIGFALRAQQMSSVGRTGAGLTAAAVRERRASSGLSKALLVGGVAAVAMLLGEAAFTWAQATGIDEAYRVSNAELGQLRAEDERWTEAAALAERLAVAEEALERQVGSIVGWESTLAELSRLSTGAIALKEISAKAEDHREPKVEIGGYASGNAKEEAGVMLTKFIERLRASDLVDSVEIGGTSLEDRDGEPALRFALTITLALADSVASADVGEVSR